jgi:hypothetical protein
MLLPSQDTYDVAVLSESADDFECNDPRPIVAVEWWGGYWNNVQPLTNVESFVIRFYDDVPGPPSHPGNLLYEEPCVVFHEDYESGGPYPATYFYHYYQTLQTPLNQVPGNIYWISIQAIYPWATGGQWGWRASDRHWNDYVAFKWAYFMGDSLWHGGYGAFGSYYDLAFVLYVDITNAVEPSTWSDIKAIFG